MDSTDGPLRGGAQNHRLSRRSSRSRHDQGEPRHPEERAHSDTSAFRRDRFGAQGGRYRRFDSAELYRRQHRQLADRQGRHDVLSGCCRRCSVIGWRLARFAGRFRAVRYGNRMLAERHLPDHPAQESRSRRYGSRSPRLPDAGNQGRVAGARLQLRQLSQRIGRQGAVRHLLEILS